MTRILILATALSGLLATSAVQADGIIPGSDTATQAHDLQQNLAVSNGTYGAQNAPGLGETRVFGYAPALGSGSLIPGSDYFRDDASEQTRRGVASSQGERSFERPVSSRDQLIPGSDSF